MKSATAAIRTPKHKQKAYVLKAQSYPCLDVDVRATAGTTFIFRATFLIKKGRF